MRDWWLTGICSSSEQYPTASRHHPYLAESSMDAHRRALAGVAVGASSMGPGGLRMGADDQRPPAPPKSGRLGVKRRQKYTRSRTGCLGCRARRIKCDEGRPVCRRCQVAKREVSDSSGQSGCANQLLLLWNSRDTTMSMRAHGRCATKPSESDANVCFFFSAAFPTRTRPRSRNVTDSSPSRTTTTTSTTAQARWRTPHRPPPPPT